MNDFPVNDRRARRAYLGCALAACVVVACGASRKAEAPATTPQPSSNQAPAPAAVDEGAAAPPEPEQSAPSSRGAPPGGALPTPRSTKKKDSKRPLDDTLAEEQSDLDVLSARLDGALTLAAPDCTSAWALRDQICDLSRRLCDLAGRSDEPDIAERCTDGKARCDRATSKVRAACPN